MFLDDLMGLVSEVNLQGVTSIDYEVEKGEVILGKMPEDLRRLYGVLQKFIDRLNALVEQQQQEVARLGDEMTNAKRKAMKQELRTYDRQRKMINSWFWDDLRLQFPEADGQDIGIRKDWQVVARAPALGGGDVIGLILV